MARSSSNFSRTARLVRQQAVWSVPAGELHAGRLRWQSQWPSDSYDLPDDGPVQPLDMLRAATRQATAYRLESQYSRLAATLPDLLGELTRAAHSYTRQHQEETYGMLAMAYRAADAIADKYSYTDLSARAIKLIRWAAAQAGDPLIGAMAAYVRTELFLSGQHPAAGLRSLDTAITSINPAASRDASAIYGSLHMRAAVAAAAIGRTGPAESHLAEAREMESECPTMSTTAPRSGLPAFASTRSRLPPN